MKLSRAFRLMYEEADLTQTELADLLQIEQKHVSRWATGETPIPIDGMLAAETACSHPAGYLLRVAGIIGDPNTTREAILADPALDRRGKDLMLAAYAAAAGDSASARDGKKPAAARSSRTTPNAKAKSRRS